MNQYKVTIRFRNPIPVLNRIEEYQNLRVNFEYENEKIIGLTHQFSVSDKLSHEEIIIYSERLLTLFWELLQYQYGIRIERASLCTEEIGANEIKTAQTGVSMDVILVKPVNLPSARFWDNPAPRLHAWLRFANDAVAADSDAEAIRLWYALYEDMRGRPTKGSNGAAEKLKHMRDFVSHGEQIRNSDLKNFLKNEVASGTTQFDPTNWKHLAVVREYRQEARSFVEKELTKEFQ